MKAGDILGIQRRVRNDPSCKTEGAAETEATEWFLRAVTFVLVLCVSPGYAPGVATLRGRSQAAVSQGADPGAPTAGSQTTKLTLLVKGHVCRGGEVVLPGLMLLLLSLWLCSTPGGGC